jgi:mono/diheme cytochrome c family protein
MMKSNRIVILIAALIFVGCNYTKIKDSPDDKNTQYNLPSGKLGELSYGLLAQKIFTPKCITCHGTSGSVNLESYSEVLRHLAQIEKSVFNEHSMPKRGSLTSEEMSYLWNWIQMGAPENAQNGSLPPLQEPIQATFESINNRIFQTSCKDCHNSTGSGKRIPLDKESLLNSPLELVIPENPDESGLVIAIERLDGKRMPPAKAGYSPLSDEAKQAIRKWIQNGAVN